MFLLIWTVIQSFCYSSHHAHRCVVNYGELRTLADTISATPASATTLPRNTWVVVYAKVDSHLTKGLAELSLHKALESGLTTQALGLYGLPMHAPPRRPTHRQIGVPPLRVRQWTRAHTCQTMEHQPHPRA